MPTQTRHGILDGILAAVAKQERVRLSERVHAGLERAKAQGRKVKRDRDKDARTIGRMRAESDSYAEIADALGRSKADVYRVARPWDVSQTVQVLPAL